MDGLLKKALPSVDTNPAIFLLLRLIVGAVFMAEGIQKFLFPDLLGVGRFVKIGIPAPEFLAPFVGAVETVGGALVLAGLLTRPAALALLVNILVAIATTKIPMLGEGGFWKTVHEARTDWCMLLGSLALVLDGGGRWSIDGIIQRKPPQARVG